MSALESLSKLHPTFILLHSVLRIGLHICFIRCVGAVKGLLGGLVGGFVGNLDGRRDGACEEVCQKATAR